MRDNQLKLIVSLFLALITFATFWQVQNHEFILYDDPQFITGNSHVQGGLTTRGIIWAFTTTYPDYWHPLPWLSHMLDCQLYGLNPKGHHLNSLLIHIANTILLFLVLSRMTDAPWRSAFVAALFAIHPLRIESVAWVAERKDVLSTFFWMLVMWAYARYVERPGTRRYLLVLLFFALGLMAKPMLVTLPFVLFLLDYWPLCRFQSSKTDIDSTPPKFRKSITFGLVLEKVPLLVLATLSSLLTLSLAQDIGTVASQEILPLKVRIANALVSYVSYIGKMIWPAHLGFFYPHPIDTLPMWQVGGAFLFLVCISSLIILLVRQRPYFLVGWLWYLGILVPVIGLIQVGAQAMADRFTYVPLIGLFVIISWAVPDIMERWHHKKNVLAILAGIVLLAFMISSRVQVQYWRNSTILFQHAIDVTSNNYVAYFHLGNALTQKGKLTEAITHYSEAVRIKPDYAHAHYNMGNVLIRTGGLKEATVHYSEAIRIKPGYDHAHNNLGNALTRQGKFKKALFHYSEAIRIKPDYADAHNNLGNALTRQGEFKKALFHYSEALRIKPDFIEAQHNMEITLQRMGKEEDLSKTNLGASPQLECWNTGMME